MNRKHKGSHAELRAAAWLLEQGYEVFKNVSSCGKIDLIAIKDGETRQFDVKSGYCGGSPIEGIEYLKMMDDGTFRVMAPRKMRRLLAREATPREIVLNKLGVS